MDEGGWTGTESWERFIPAADAAPTSVGRGRHCLRQPGRRSEHHRRKRHERERRGGPGMLIWKIGCWLFKPPRRFGLTCLMCLNFLFEKAQVENLRSTLIYGVKGQIVKSHPVCKVNTQGGWRRKGQEKPQKHQIGIAH